MPIRSLPDTLINQIAAGEVVERPASVVKELVENALDAGARRVDIDLEEGGIRLIRIRDDGGGIAPDELPLALSRHATSKIASIEDLEAVMTLGFRGEALPSIASVSRFCLTSRRREDPHAAQLRVEGGRAHPITPAPHAPGTTVEVRDLFYNVPARRKFLRAERTELAHIEEWLRSLALARPEIELRIGVDGKASRRYRSEGDPAARVHDALGEQFMSHALRIEQAGAGLRLHGWIAQPAYTRNSGDQQFLYVNGRSVRDRNIGHAAKSAYKEVLFHGRQPAYVLFLELDPLRVDVNVHPAKHEVRFRDGRLIYDFVLRTLHDALGESRAAFQAARAMPVDLTGGTHALPAVRMEEARAFYGALYGDGGSAATLPAPVVTHDGPPLGQAMAVLHARYLLAQDAHGLLMFDLPAVHRALGAQRLHAAKAGIGLLAQPLLLPVEMDCVERGDLDAAIEALSGLGFVLEPLPASRLRVRSIPALLAEAEPITLVNAVLAAASEGTDAVLHAMAQQFRTPARALTLPEANALLRDLERLESEDLECLYRRVPLARIEDAFNRDDAEITWG